MYKAGQLVSRAGNAVLAPVSLALARSLCFATREDLLPDFRRAPETLASLPEPPTERQPGADPSDPVSATLARSLEWLGSAAHQLPIAELFDRLLAANAWNVLHYDLRKQDAWKVPVAQSTDWLDVTHGLTFANAVRIQCTRFPRLWRQGLVQMACFAGRNHGHCDASLGETAWLVPEPAPFLDRIHERLLDHGLRAPILSAHLIKTARAVEEELPTASPRTHTLLLAALNRFFHSPLKQKHSRRLAHQAVQLVARDFA